MAFDVGAVVGHLQLRKDQWNQAIKDVKADQKSLSGLVLRNSQQFKQMGRAMTIAGGAIIGAFGLMVKAHSRLDQSMTESLAIMDDVSDEMRKEMAKAALEMSTKTVFAAEKLAASYFFLASAGMDAAESIKALPVVAKFAQAGTFNLAVATDLLTDAQTALGLSVGTAEEKQKSLIRVSDVLVGANTLANASVKQFAESLTNKAAAALVNVNKEVEEGVAVLAAYADKGVKGQLAGQRLTMMMNGLFAATRRNKGAWDEAGISLFNADESMRDISDIIQSLEGYLGAMTVKQREAALAALGFNLRTKDSILTLLGSSEKIRQWTEDLKGMQGITEEVAAKQLLTFNNQLKLLRNEIVNAAISIGGTLTPALTKLVQSVKGTVGRVAEWIKEHPKLTEIIAKSAIAVGGLLAVLGPIAIMLPGLITMLPALAAGFTALLGPIGAVAIAATATGVALNKLIDNYSKKLDKEVDEMMEASKSRHKFFLFQRKLIADEIVTVKEWSDIYHKHGRNYKRVMVAIANLPEYEHIRNALQSIIDKQEKLNEVSAKYGTTLTVDILPPANKFKFIATDMVRILKDAGFKTEGLAITTQYYAQEVLLKTALPATKNMTGMLKKLGIEVEDLSGKKKKATDDEIGLFEKIGIAAIVSLGQSKLGAIAQATMSTYAGAAKSLELLGMPLAIPFIAASIATGLKQVAAIVATPIPSAEKGAYLPSPAIIEAGHGSMGEVILPLDKAPQFMADRGGSSIGGAKINLNFYAPIISSVGISERDMDDASEYLLEKVRSEFERYGGRLNG